MLFLGFIEGPFLTMDEAKSDDPEFALRVLDEMKSKITV